MSQADLADASGVSRRTIQEIEGGGKSPTVQTLESVVQALGSEMSDLFVCEAPATEAPLGTRADILDAIREGLATNLTKSVTTMSPEKQRLVALISDLSDSRVQTLLDMLSIDSPTILADEERAAHRKRR